MRTTYYTPQDIAEMFKISYDKALDFIKYSGVQYVMIGRQYRVSEDALNAYTNPPEKKKLHLKKH